MALHDNLTGLPNRALVVDRLHHALARLSDRHTTVAVLFIDLDRFKVVNDGLGHDTGDELLVEVGKRLTATVRRQDTVARLGGDEFVVVCEDLADESLAEELAARAAEALSAPFTLTRAEVSVTASVGIALTRRAGDAPSRLLRDADAAMYRAKGRGGARWELFDEAMHTQAVTRLLTERSLRQALEHDELRVVFQRQFELASGAAVSDEALLRWAHPTRGLVMPVDFIEVAEETGIIVPIGRWVLEQACAHSRRAESVTDAPTAVSVNISARNLMRADYSDLVGRCIQEHALEPARLCFEISEIALLDDLDTTNDALRALKDLGVRLAIDDFGTGGSSLTYLRQFPFDELKIDPSFIAGLGRSAADDAIVAATIDMAHALGMVVAAEGVETEGQRVRLVELGCDRAQGYLLAEPAPEAGAPQLPAAEVDTRPRLTIVKEQTA
jgi:diguanylate cyclase (GGDEF)-like protein